MTAHGLHLPLPPSMLFQQLPSSRSSPKKGFKKEDDLFLVAYLMEFTKGRRAYKERKRDSLLGLISYASGGREKGCVGSTSVGVDDDDGCNVDIVAPNDGGGGGAEAPGMIENICVMYWVICSIC
ncbi:hypothetical protein Cni_G19120 [Canna indica]|uniref:Uncharacterized protein n=1 Tax=Canna indica TaxID=4628 RepID=A0AAQ3QJF7_9LILI|nr:hypothetical protein Cni_G19120 [Canna indica]